jgi:hypothetical protein
VEGRTDINKQDGAPELRARARLLRRPDLRFSRAMTRLVFLQIIQGERYTSHTEQSRAHQKNSGTQVWFSTARAAFDR